MLVHQIAIGYIVVGRDMAVTHAFFVGNLLLDKLLEFLASVPVIILRMCIHESQQTGSLYADKMAHVFIAMQQNGGRKIIASMIANQLAVCFGDAGNILHYFSRSRDGIVSGVGFQDFVGGVTQGALEDGAEHLDLVFQIVDAVGLFPILVKGLFHVCQRRLVTNHQIRKGKVGRDEADVRLHIAVKLLLAVGGRIDAQIIRHENPGVDLEIALSIMLTPRESHFEFDGELVVYFGGDVDHKMG